MRKMRLLAGTRAVAARAAGFVALLAIPASAWAGTFQVLPEPETLALLGAGAVALMIARRRNKK